MLALILIIGLTAGCAPKNDNLISEEIPSSADTPPVSPETGTPEVDPPGAIIRIAALKGPTAMGMVKMLSDNDNLKDPGGNTYTAEIFGTPDEVSALLINGTIDVAAVPCNLASVLYNKTGGKIKIAAINTLGVLYIVENGETIQSVEDLIGKTIYSTGQGTTPEFSLNYILRQNGIDPENDINIEYKSESTEIAALLSSNDDAIIAVLPQPYVSTVQMQNENVRIALDLTEEWNKCSTDSTLVTGVVVVRTEFLEQNEAAFSQFMDDYAASAEYVKKNISDTAALIEKYDIVPAKVAERALPFCNINFISGIEMQTLVNGYLSVLYDANPQSVGGALPDDNFYFKS